MKKVFTLIFFCISRNYIVDISKSIFFKLQIILIKYAVRSSGGRGVDERSHAEAMFVGLEAGQFR